MNERDASDALHLRYVLESIERIQEYTTGGLEEFLGSRMIQDAVIRNLQTLAESTQRLSDEIKSTQPSTPWAKIAGLRNRLVHEYLRISLRQIWIVISQDLDLLQQAVEEMMNGLDARASQQPDEGENDASS